MTTPAIVFCQHPGCGIRLTDPVSAARGYGKKHDPHPELRHIIRPRRPPLVAPRPPAKPDHGDEPDLLDLLTGEEPQCQLP